MNLNCFEFFVDGILRQINFKWAVVQSKESCVAVIDGCRLSTDIHYHN